MDGQAIFISRAPQRKSRKNTLEEKRRMRNQRKRRLRDKVKRRVQLQQSTRPRDDVDHKASALQLERQREKCCDMEKKVMLYKSMSRTYWDRWQWELQQRRQGIIQNKIFPTHPRSNTGEPQEIDPAMLVNPGSNDDETYFIGRGSFSLVKLQSFRGIKVAVKELLPRTNLVDVRHEASILTRLCHPYVPYLFGMCTSKVPYRIVMQFEGIATQSKPSTLQETLSMKNISSSSTWLSICAQLMEALRYLHEEAFILHNDIKTNNILISERGMPFSTTIHSSALSLVLIDFGEATSVEKGKKYCLTWVERAEYTRKYPHIAPEIIDGMGKQTQKSDIFSAGTVLHRVIDSLSSDQLPLSKKNIIAKLATDCRSSNVSCRPRAEVALGVFKTLDIAI